LRFRDSNRDTASGLPAVLLFCVFNWAGWGICGTKAKKVGEAITHRGNLFADLFFRCVFEPGAVEQLAVYRLRRSRRALRFLLPILRRRLGLAMSRGSFPCCESGAM
jgi:hypothetical protein